MKKLLGIVVLGLLLSSNAYSESNNNLKGVKEFDLEVSHNGCNDQNFEKELTTNAKYLISNSKIKLSDAAPEMLLLKVLTADGVKQGTNICTSYMKLQVRSYGMVSNSAGYEWYHSKESYRKSGLAWNTGPDYVSRHRDNIIRNFDRYVKEFIIDWNDAQK